MRYFALFSALMFISLLSANCNPERQSSQMENPRNRVFQPDSSLEVATLGGGCFWCLEAAYERIKGVKHVVSGYAGGNTKNPSYREVGAGGTGHAEVVQIHFDPQIIGYEEILEIFWTIHDPTTLNRQGGDVGPEYRSIILTHNEPQKEIARRSINETASLLWNNPVVTEIKPLEDFYEAEKYHQDYYDNNANQGYCRAVINPKLKKLKNKFSDRIKEGYE